jgi:Flp pilus assembly protein protease CpaA
MAAMALVEVVLMVLAFCALLIASYADIKTREIPDWLNYGLIFAALGVRAIVSVTQGWNVFVSGLLGLAAFFSLGYVFYHSRQWGGGDSKLLMGMGAIIGISYPWNMESWYLAWFLITMLLIGALYGLITMIIIAIQHWHKVKPQLVHTLKKYKTVQLVLILTSILFLIMTYFYSFVWPMAIVLLGFFYLFLLVHTVEKTCFTKPIAIAKLTEGDWLAEKVEVHGKGLLQPKTLEKSDLAALHHLEQEGKLKTVVIKEGIPFAPSFLLGYIAFLIKPDWIMVILGKVLS